MNREVRLSLIFAIVPLCLCLLGCPPNATVPNVVRTELGTAQAMIGADGLAVGAVTEQFSDTIPAGQVISQVPAAGASVAPGSAVSLVVSERSGRWRR